MKEDQARFETVIKKLLLDIGSIALYLKPFMPETSEKIEMALKAGAVEPLFKRI